ncbi:MAG: cation-transporting P-type ATPase, partial [Methylococcus sp.]
QGLRVLAFARRELTGSLPETAAEAEVGMVFLGLVGMADPVRPEVPDAIQKARTAGIRVVMITGDNPATALAVAREAGIAANRAVLDCDLPAKDGELGRLLAGDAPVLARVAPEDKLRIARVLQEQGEVVAMTGDGVNDAPALRQADIGVAMGRSGTDVAREAADLVLLDDNFAHIVESVEEGRAAYDNIKRFLTYHLTDNIAELTPFVVWSMSGGENPLMISVPQVLALDIGTDLLPALALGAERADPAVMRRPPRARNARLLDRHLLGRAFGFLGPIEALLSMAMLPIGAWLFSTGPECRCRFKVPSWQRFPLWCSRQSSSCRWRMRSSAARIRRHCSRLAPSRIACYWRRWASNCRCCWFSSICRRSPKYLAKEG